MAHVSEFDTPTASYVAGRWHRDGDPLAVVDPATEKSVAEVATVRTAEVDEAVAAAGTSAAIWRSMSSWERSRVLRRTGEILREWIPEAAAVLTAEQGKPIAQSEWEVAASADQFDWYADEARRIYGRTVDGQDRGARILVQHEPVGTVAAFSAWNFPSLLSARKIAPALAAGCPVIISPSAEAPLSTLVLAAAAEAAGLPAGMLSVLVGDPPMISERLIAAESVRKISLTGSVPVGRMLLHLAAERIKGVSMELGGQAPVLVFDDADVDAAARACVAGKFRNAGQVCASPSRFLVQRGIVDRFTERFVELTSGLVVGDGRDRRTEVGPLANARRIDASSALVEDARAKGATVLTGGGRDMRFDAGYFFEPTVLGAVTTDMAIMRDEPFAPVAPITAFDELEEALAVANSTPFALASYVFTGRTARAVAAAEGLEAGMVGVNTLALAAAEAPFGGNKESGFGREGGYEGIADYLVPKYIKLAGLEAV